MSFCFDVWFSSIGLFGLAQENITLTSILILELPFSVSDKKSELSLDSMIFNFYNTFSNNQINSARRQRTVFYFLRKLGRVKNSSAGLSRGQGMSVGCWMVIFYQANYLLESFESETWQFRWPLFT